LNAENCGNLQVVEQVGGRIFWIDSCHLKYAGVNTTRQFPLFDSPTALGSVNKWLRFFVFSHVVTFRVVLRLHTL
jgi:hypothetical protein